MGEMIDGVWHDQWYRPDQEGAFQRPPTQFRDGIDHPEPDRYHLYVSWACPWAHRTILVRALRGLDQAVTLTAVDPRMGAEGWVFPSDHPEPIHGATRLQDVYRLARPRYTGRVTVPVLWDKRRHTIVNNESREVMRLLDTGLESFARGASLYPDGLRATIDQTLDALYEPLNNGVYRAGFATQQGAYERAVSQVFDALDQWDQVLGRQRFTCGDVLTEADIALFTTLFRFDLVYYSHFKCNRRRVQDYPNLWGFVRDIYQMPGVRETCRVDEIKTHYYWSQPTVNPTRIIPVGPTIDFDTAHGRS